MSDTYDADVSRRRFIKLVGGSALVLPVAGLSGCSSEESAPVPEPEAAAEAAAESPPPRPVEQAGQMATEQAPAAAPAAGGALPELSESDPQATSLGYRHEAADVDKTRFPRYESGQLCSNCALYLGGAEDEWAGCSIFPGKAVKGTGWCNVYAPKAG